MDNILTLITQLGKDVYQCYVCQALMTGKIMIIASSVSVLISFLLLLASDWLREDDWDDGTHVIFVHLFAFAVVASMILIPCGIVHVLNPQYFAIKDIIG